MAVQFIFGSAGAGKSRKLYETLVKRAIDDPRGEFVAVVPEQYSMESQKEIVRLHPRHGAMNIEVMSFERLAMRLFEEIGLVNVKVMDDLGKTLLVRKTMESCKDDLKLYAGKISMPGFTEKIKSAISELEQYGIDDEELSKMIDDAAQKPSLSRKLTDLRTIYKQFNAYLETHKITREGALEVFLRYAVRSERIRNTEYFIDGFTGFTPVQRSAAGCLMRYAKNVTFAFTLPVKEISFQTVVPQDLFAPVKKTVSDLKADCVRYGVKMMEDIPVENVRVKGGSRPYRLKESAELSHIEANLFRYEKSSAFKGDCRDVVIYAASDPQSEARFVAFTVASLVRDGKSKSTSYGSALFYRDFAVITGDMEGYYRYLDEAFREYDIPAFIDHKRSVTSNPFVDALTSVIDIILTDFSYESVFHYLRLGVIQDRTDDIDLLENYVLMSGRRGYKSYSREWERNYNFFTPEDLLRINGIRSLFVESLAPLREALKEKNATVREFTEALLDFIKRERFDEKLSAFAGKFNAGGDFDKEQEYRQTYGVITDILSKAADEFGDGRVSLKEYRDILSAGAESVKVGVIPPGLDSVMVGDIERTRLKDIKKVVFLIGVNDGVLPKNRAGGGIFSDQEREYLRGRSFELAPSSREDAFAQRYYLYTALTKPSERLYVTYAKNNADGETLRKSYLISVLLRLFPSLSVKEEEKDSLNARNILQRREAFRYTAKALRRARTNGGDGEFFPVYSLLSETPEGRARLLPIVNAAFYRREDEKLDQNAVAGLYSVSHNIGITRLERYAACAYSQFLSNGLKLSERRRYELAATDLGSLYHRALDLFCEQINSQGIDWAAIDEKQRKSIVNACVDRAIAEDDSDVMSGTAGNRYIAGRVREVTDLTVRVLGDHLAAGKFRPAYFEYGVEHGRIDRVDVYEKDDRVYVKVIDYKSGNKAFSVKDTFTGLQLQLMMYLDDAVKNLKKIHPDKKVIPAGAFYYVIKDPYVKLLDFTPLFFDYLNDPRYRNMSDDKAFGRLIDSVRQKEFKMSGIISADDEILSAIDTKAYETRGKSEVVSLIYTKTGIRPGGCSVSQKTLEAVLEYSRNKAAAMQSRIFSGDISVNPYEDSCKYCLYRNVCGFDTALGDHYRELEKQSDQELLALMRTEYEKAAAEGKKAETDAVGGGAKCGKEGAAGEKNKETEDATPAGKNEEKTENTAAAANVSREKAEEASAEGGKEEKAKEAEDADAMD